MLSGGQIGKKTSNHFITKARILKTSGGGGGGCDWGRVSMGADPWEVGSIQLVDLGGGRPEVNL